MKFGEVLRELLEEREISQKKLASELELLAPTLGRYIRNDREPDIETIKIIAKYFGVTTDYLLDYQSGNTATHKEDELLRVFRSMKPEQQEMYLEQGKVIVRLNHKGKDRAKSS